MLYYLLWLSTLTVNCLQEHTFCADVVHLASYDQYDIINTRMASSKTSVLYSTSARTETCRKMLIKRSILCKTFQRFSNHYMWTNWCNFRSQHEHYLQDFFSECSKNEVRYKVSGFDPRTSQVITCGPLSSFAHWVGPMATFITHCMFRDKGILVARKNVSGTDCDITRHDGL